MSPEKIPVMIIGAGSAANTMHLAAWKKIPSVEVTAICDINEVNAARTAKRWRIPHRYTDIDLLLKNEKQGIVDICTSPETHVPLAERAMDAGYHVLIEKPLALTIEDNQRILMKYSERSDRGKLCVVQNFLFDPPILEIRSILAKKRLDVLSIDIRMLHTPNDEFLSTRNHWVHSLPGGRFGENLIHPIYLLRNLMGGKLNLRDVFSVKRGTFEWVDFDELNVALDNGTTYGSIHISFNSPRWTMPLSLRIYGKEAILYFDGTNQTFIMQKHLLDGYLPEGGVSRVKVFNDSLSNSMSIMRSISNNAIKVLTGTWQTGHEYLFRLFVDAIIKDRELPYSFEESCEANQIFLEVLDRLTNNRA